MLKRILNIVIVTSLFLVFGLGSVSAEEKGANVPNNSTEKVNKEEYKEMMQAVKEKVEQGEEDQIEGLSEVIDFKNKYSESQIIEFVKNTEAYNQEVPEELEVDLNEKKVIDFEDGSFIVVGSTTEQVLTPSEEGEISPMLEAGNVGSSWKTNYYQQWWGIYLAMEAHLNTYYTVYSDKIYIYDTDYAGTKSNPPTTVDLISTSTVENNKKTVKSKGNYRKTNGVVIGGQPIGTVTTHTLRTTISISSVQGNKVYWTTSSVTE